MQILITGITGRVGANVARRFLDRGDRVRGFVWPGDRQAEKLKLLDAEFFEGDLRSLEDVAAAARGCDWIFHMGAAFQAGGPFTHEQYFDTNVKGTFNVLEAAVGLGPQLKHLFFSSTDATMQKYLPGGIPEPITETSLPLVTTAWYGYSKVLGEHLVDRYVRADRVPATVFRFAAVWGAGEVLKFQQFRLSHFIKEFAGRSDDVGKAMHARLSKLAGGREKLVIACDENGRPYKKHCVEVRDLVHAFDAAAGKPSTLGKTYQLGAPSAFTWDKVIPYLATRLEIPYERVNIEGAAPTFYEYDMTAARRDFGYAPKVDIFKTIDDALGFERDGKGEVIQTRVTGSAPPGRAGSGR